MPITPAAIIRTRSCQSTDRQLLSLQLDHPEHNPNQLQQTQPVPTADPQLDHSHLTRPTHEPNEHYHPNMTPSAGFLSHPCRFPHEDHPSDSHYHTHDHHLILSPSDQRCLMAPVAQITQEPSADTFFASHKAHRSFRGVVEKFHQNPPNPQFDQPFDSTQWAHWSHQNEEDINQTSAMNQNQVLDGGQPSTHSDPAIISHQTIQQPTAPYRTRSLVHRLVNLPDPAEHKPPAQPSDSSTLQPFFYDCLSSSQFGSSRSASHSNSMPIGSVQDLRSVLNKDEPPADSQRIQSTFDTNRIKDGLPSNSHHLLNSPELKTAQINPNRLAQNNQIDQTPADPGATDSEHQPHTSQSIQPSSQSCKSTKTATCKRTTPQKNKASPNHHFEHNFADPPNHPPSDDAASILLTLSRHDQPKHGMSLRRGRGGAGSRADPQQNDPSSDSRPPAPPTPSGPRYRTRSQMNEEIQQDDQPINQDSPPGPISSQHPGNQPAADSSSIAQGQSHLVPSNLGYGFPTGHNQSLISVSGSTSASTCTSRSNTGDGSALNITPGQESSFSLYNLVSKPQISFPGRLQFKTSAVSTPLSMTHSSTTNSIVHSGTAMMDDDAKSSFSISTQATSLISPPGYFSRRTFPPEVPIDPHFPRLYRSFFVSSAFGDREPIKSQAEAYKITVMKAPPNSNFNTPAHGYLDLYTPRYVKGVGAEKLGLCCICAEPKDRGGGDTALWLKMKVSSYSYHLSFFHGINNADGLPFSPPVEIRHVRRCHVAANEKLELKEGRCHQCNKWVPMEGVKMQEVKVPELFWWKHAKSCHKSRLAGECHVHIPDEIFDLVTRQQPCNGSGGGYLPVSSCSTPYSYSSNDLATSNSPYGSRYHPASPAPTCASSVSQSGGSRVHPSVAAQRASAGRVYKRKASNSSLSGARAASSITGDPTDSPQASNWQPLSLSTGTAGSTNSTQLIHQHFIQHPQSPTPTHPSHPMPNGRKTRRSNMLS
ncbi:hypothetical protein PGT21_026494 [Puccinia graminis f. sp. tritici]|uniref:Transcription regulator Rua1 C-terminal domain-containing protein n=2 Tax=Puccinia graminis f. sp. tritici TaxID=56615 RepID=E3K298_PUCGT|nr:uncharacterized protein PGTG_04423 [Puccinia graminis f. sp. tritici CRL 75-36-700-3]EFP78467.2 hypothetical protein PGTG_04423 [Puccinia graminis f. sp. tritici CRL 75-36-700-3]KAA1119468.1 hypothetical protein PGT21_026494 [Puccinia graminis f. sp. tritici]